MSSRITATPNVADASVALVLEDFPPGPVVIHRQDANGTRRVRLPLGAVVDGAGSFAVTDYELELSGDAVYSAPGTRTNALTNPSAETDTAGWMLSGTGGTLTRDTTEAWTGAASFKVTAGATFVSLNRSAGNAVPVAEGQTWTVSVYVKGAGTVSVRIHSDETGTGLPGGFSPSINLTAAWQRVTVSAPVPSGVSTIEPLIRVEAGTTVYVDAVLVEEAPAPAGPYLEGTQAAAVTSAFVSVYDAAREGCIVHSAGYPTSKGRWGGIKATDWPIDRDTGAQLHNIIDRPDPIDTGGVARSREVTVSWLVDSHATAFALEELAASRDTDYLFTRQPAGERCVVIRQSDWSGLDVTMIVQRVSVRLNPANTRPRRWLVTFTGRETFTGPPILEAAP